MATNKLSKLNWRLTFAVLAVAIGIGWKLSLTNGQLLPGIDGAYYWVQVRSILNDFDMAFDDLPLVFWIQALFALIVGNVELGVRISDAVLPALSAIPIYLMLKNSKQTWLPAFAILVGLLHPVQLYFFTGDFIKNAAAMPVAFFIGWILYSWGRRSTKWSLLYLFVSFVIVGLTHFGTLLLCFLLVALWALFYLRKKPLSFWLRTGVLTLVLSSATLVALALLVPARFDRLVEFVTQPVTIFAAPFWQLMFLMRTDFAIIYAMFIGQIGSLALGYLLWRNRKKLDSASLSLAASSLITAFLLSSPLVGIEWASRFIALSFAPLLLAAIVLWQAVEQKSVKTAISLVAISTLATSLALAPSGAKPSAITDDEYKDLVVASEEFSFPDNSIVVARHGLEFLVAWEMNTHVIQEETYLEDDLSSYESVYLLATDGPGTSGAPKGEEAPSDKPKEVKPPGGVDSKDPASGGLVYSNGSVTITKLR